MSVTEHTRKPASKSLGHLTVGVDDRRPIEVRFQFEVQQRRLMGGVAFSLLWHVVVGVVVVLLARYAAGTFASQPMETIPFHSIVYLDQKGPGGGGGGGGNRMPTAKPAKPVAPKVEPAEVSRPVPKPAPVLPPPDLPPLDTQSIPVQMLGDVSVLATGNLDGAPPDARGSGSGGGSGTGVGGGIGPGNGPGVGPGWGGGFGGGAYRPGSGIENPMLLKKVDPEYTADAMRAKIQGIVVVECVVLPDGTVGDVRVVKSLDPLFGLDLKAIEAAKRWRFIPAKRQGKPIPIIVNIELTFSLR